jgi:hypothetical protein
MLTTPLQQRRPAGIPGWPFLFDLYAVNTPTHQFTTHYLAIMTQDQIKDLRGRAEALRRYL